MQGFRDREELAYLFASAPAPVLCAGFIFGNNTSRAAASKSEEVAMTAPVVMQQQPQQEGAPGGGKAEKVAMTAPVVMQRSGAEGKAEKVAMTSPVVMNQSGQPNKMKMVRGGGGGGAVKNKGAARLFTQAAVSLPLLLLLLPSHAWKYHSEHCTKLRVGSHLPPFLCPPSPSPPVVHHAQQVHLHRCAACAQGLKRQAGGGPRAQGGGLGGMAWGARQRCRPA